VHSSGYATSAKDGAELAAAAANDRLDLNCSLSEVCRYLVEPHPDIQTSRSPERGARKSRVGNLRETQVACGTRLSEQPEYLEDTAIP
jgi:hypothetical protein